MDGRQSSASALLVQHRLEIPLNVFFFPFFLSRDVERGGMRGPTFDRTRAQLEERENGERKRVPWAERQQSPANEFSPGVPGYRFDEAYDKRLFTTGFFPPSFVLFILVRFANAPVSIYSEPAKMRCGNRNETRKTEAFTVDSVEMHSA